MNGSMRAELKVKDGAGSGGLGRKGLAGGLRMMAVVGGRGAFVTYQAKKGFGGSVLHRTEW